MAKRAASIVSKDARWPTRLASDDDRPIIAPPDTVTVHDRQRPILFDPQGRPLHRRIGFRPTEDL